MRSFTGCEAHNSTVFFGTEVPLSRDREGCARDRNLIASFAPPLRAANAALRSKKGCVSMSSETSYAATQFQNPTQITVQML